MKKVLKLLQNSENKRRLIYTEGVIFFICFMFCIFAPFEIYLSAKGDFFFEGYELICFFGLLFGVLFIGLSSINVISVMKFSRGGV